MHKLPTRCNRWFPYCRSHSSLNMFRAPLCPSSGAQEYYTGGRCLWYLVLWFSSCRSGVELWVVCPVCRMLLLHLVGILFPHIISTNLDMLGIFNILSRNFTWKLFLNYGGDDDDDDDDDDDNNNNNNNNNVNLKQPYWTLLTYFVKC